VGVVPGVDVPLVPAVDVPLVPDVDVPLVLVDVAVLPVLVDGDVALEAGVLLDGDPELPELGLADDPDVGGVENPELLLTVGATLWPWFTVPPVPVPWPVAVCPASASAAPVAPAAMASTSTIAAKTGRRMPVRLGAGACRGGAWDGAWGVDGARSGGRQVWARMVWVGVS
jgi:hypothetical protein